MNEKHGPNGFLLGILIGGAVGALVSTKRGRQILKDIAEFGIEYVGNTINVEDLESILNNDEEEVMAGEMDATESRSEKGEKIYVRKEEKEPSRRRRLFRGIKK